MEMKIKRKQLPLLISLWMKSIELKAESAQTFQRKARLVAYGHGRSLFFHHPGRDLCQRAIRLPDRQNHLVPDALPARDIYHPARKWVERVADNAIATMIAGIMKLLRLVAANRILLPPSAWP